MTFSVLSLTYLLPSLVLPSILTSADALKGEHLSEASSISKSELLTRDYQANSHHHVYIH